ncbi:hypothetical protein ACJIZ3_008758 [Penstemon smallii]|uniref:Uncharacterized protein n=1 Tax=Penstemon smallii TaxID=265156 RepID=A0ABD3TCF9_9LAMI
MEENQKLIKYEPELILINDDDGNIGSEGGSYNMDSGSEGGFYNMDSGGVGHLTRIRQWIRERKSQTFVVLSLWNSVAESEGQVIDETDEAFSIIRATGLFKNLKFITHAISSKDHFAHSDSFFHVSLDKICPIADVVADNKVDKFLVKVQAMITDPDQKYSYMACEKCFSGVDADYDYQYTFVACKAFTHAKPSESLNVTVFGKHATELSEMAASRCMELYSEGAPLPLETINQSLSGKSFIMKIRKRERSIGDSMQYQYVVLNMLERKAEDDIGCSSSTTNSKSTIDLHDNYLNST